MSSSSFEPSAFIARVVAALGIIVIAWKTAKTVKRFVDIGFDQLEQLLDESARAPGGGAAAGSERRTSARPRQRFSTADARMGLHQAEAQVLHLLRVWVLFGLANMLAVYNIPYGIELRALVVVIGCLPTLETSSITSWLFAYTAEPLFGSVAPRYFKRAFGIVRGCLAAASPSLRWAAEHAYSPDMVKAAKTRDLIAAERELAHAVHATMEVSARRLANGMPRASTTSAGSGGFSLDRLVAMLPTPLSAQKERRARARLPLSPILQDDDEDGGHVGSAAAPAPAAQHARHASAPVVTQRR